MEIISTTTAPTPGGHYSQAVRQGDFIFISGQLPIRPETGEKVLGSIEEQTAQVLANLFNIARAAGSDREFILKVTVFISGISLWSKVNEVYADFFLTHRPARAIVPVTTLHHGFLIEIDAIATVAPKDSPNH